jgi:hypothetical protein
MGTFFEYSSAAMEMKPPWWETWKGCDGQRACWILDALDEDNRRYQHIHRVLDLVQGLSPETRRRLFLLMFVRENERPRNVDQRLGEIYESSGPTHNGDLQVMRLAPVCARIARQIVGSDEAFHRVCRLITENRLQAVASLPIVLQSLSRWKAGASVGLKDLWVEVLKWILRDRRREDEAPEKLCPIDDRFRAATRIAAALTFAGAFEIDAGVGDSSSPSVPDLFPATMPKVDQLRLAAWEVF